MQAQQVPPEMRPEQRRMLRAANKQERAARAAAAAIMADEHAQSDRMTTNWRGSKGDWVDTMAPVRSTRRAHVARRRTAPPPRDVGDDAVAAEAEPASASGAREGCFHPDLTSLTALTMRIGSNRSTVVRDAGSAPPVSRVAPRNTAQGRRTVIGAMNGRRARENKSSLARLESDGTKPRPKQPPPISVARSHNRGEEYPLGYSASDTFNSTLQRNKVEVSSKESRHLARELMRYRRTNRRAPADTGLATAHQRRRRV